MWRVSLQAIIITIGRDESPALQDRWRFSLQLFPSACGEQRRWQEVELWVNWRQRKQKVFGMWWGGGYKSCCRGGRTDSLITCCHMTDSYVMFTVLLGLLQWSERWDCTWVLRAIRGDVGKNESTLKRCSYTISATFLVFYKIRSKGVDNLTL